MFIVICLLFFKVGFIDLFLIVYGVIINLFIINKMIKVIVIEIIYFNNFFFNFDIFF